MASSRNPSAARGFTLIEVLVSLLILAVLAATAWKGMDAISRAREVADGSLKQTLRMQSVMTQWDADMAQVLDTVVVPGLEFDGAVLRLTRRSQAGVQVVAWLVRNGRWIRWSSPVSTKVGDLEKYWASAYQMQGHESGSLTALPGVDEWQVYCFRAGAMTNCQSTGDLAKVGGTPSASPTPAPGGTTPALAVPVARIPMPEAVRMQLVLSDRSGLAGVLQRDTLLAPQ